MPGIPVRKRESHEGSKYLSQIVGQRMKEARHLRGWSQDDIAERMNDLGHPTWKRQTVGQVENAERHVTVEELGSMVAAAQTSLAFLLSPASSAPPYDPEPVDIGGPAPLDAVELRGLYGFNWSPLPQAWTYYMWPDMDLVSARNWDEVLDEGLGLKPVADEEENAHE